MESFACSKCCPVSESYCILNKRHSFQRPDERSALPASQFRQCQLIRLRQLFCFNYQFVVINSTQKTPACLNSSEMAPRLRRRSRRRSSGAETAQLTSSRALFPVAQELTPRCWLSQVVAATSLVYLTTIFSSSCASRFQYRHNERRRGELGGQIDSEFPRTKLCKQVKC